MSKPKYMIRCDLEGVSGVVSYDQVVPGKPDYPESRANFNVELLALIEGLRDGGAGTLVIYDEHCDGRNVDLAQLPEDCWVVCGKPPYRPDWAGALDESFAGMILLGLHSMAGSGELLCHTYEHDIARLTVNGEIVGEIGMEAAIAGDFGVPLVLVTADSAGCAEAAKLIPGVRTLATKESRGETGALCRCLLDVAQQLRAMAAEVVRTPPAVKPLFLGPPAELRVEFNDGPYLDTLRRLYRSRMESADALTLHEPSVLEAYAAYWRLKLKVARAAECGEVQ